MCPRFILEFSGYPGLGAVCERGGGCFSFFPIAWGLKAPREGAGPYLSSQCFSCRRRAGEERGQRGGVLLAWPRRGSPGEPGWSPPEPEDFHLPHPNPHPRPCPAAIDRSVRLGGGRGGGAGGGMLGCCKASGRAPAAVSTSASFFSSSVSSSSSSPAAAAAAAAANMAAPRSPGGGR